MNDIITASSLKKIKEEANELVNKSILENQILMYGCYPNTDYPPLNPGFPLPETTITTIPNTQSIEDYKKKFLELFTQMEIDLGKCKMINIKHNKIGIIVDITF